MIWLSVILVTGCALFWDLGVVLQKRAADTLPPLEPGRGFAAALRQFLKSPAWMGGLLASIAGFGLFAWALDFTPVSLARSIQGGGFVVLAFLSVAFLKHRLTVREWLGVIAVTGGVLLLGLSEPAEQKDPAAIDPLQIAIGIGAVLAVCGLIQLIKRPLGISEVVSTSAVAGSLLGLGDVLTRVLMVTGGRRGFLSAIVLIGPFLSMTYVAGFLIQSRSYQQGRAIVVTGVTDLASRLVTLFIGVLALDEALPTEPLHRLGRVAGFACVFAGTGALAHFSAEALNAKNPELSTGTE